MYRLLLDNIYYLINAISKWLAKKNVLNKHTGEMELATVWGRSFFAPKTVM